MWEALGNVLTPYVFMWNIIGVLAGMIIGALPGLSATMGVAILTPLTFWLEPTAGLAVLLGVYNSAIWAGGISAILINTPGTAASIAQTMDGYAMTKQKKIGLALNINTVYSVFGGLFSTVVLIYAAFPIARFALKFGPPEFFALGLFGLSMMITVSGKEMLKGMMMGLFGVLVATVGFDPMFGVPRFTFGTYALMDGVPFTIALIGMFGIGEMLTQIYEKKFGSKDVYGEKLEITREMGRIWPTKQELKESNLAVILSTAFSVLVGAIPGTGGSISSIICWQQAKQLSKKPEEYGNGSFTGLAVSSVSNNATIGGAMTTMMTLGIPGDPTTAVLIGSLMMYGLQPGPRLFVTNPSFVMNVMALMIIGNLSILVLGMLTAKMSSVILYVKQEVIWIAVIGFCILGSFAVNTSLSDIVVMMIAGFFGFLCKRASIPMGPFILALLLGPIAESNFSRSLAMSQGDYSIFFTRPVTLITLLITVFSLFFPLIRAYLKGRGMKQMEAFDQSDD